MPELDAAIIEQIATKTFRRETNLVDEADKYSMDELVRAFSNLRQRMSQIINGLTPDQINYNPDPETYSLSEVVSHLISAQGNVYNAFLDLSASSLPHIDPIPRGPGAGAEHSLTSQILQTRLQQATDGLITLVRDTYTLANDAKRVEIGPFGQASYKGAMLFQLTHDLDHLKQSQTVRRSPLFPKKTTEVTTESAAVSATADAKSTAPDPSASR